MAEKKRKTKQLIIIAIFLVIAIGLGSAIGAITWMIQESPDISDYGNWKTSESTMVYTANGELLTKLYRENRVYVPLEKIPKDIQNAVISIEDIRFREHYGIDLKGILRAIWVDLKHMAKVEGASTITQQLAKNVLLTHEKLFSRKLQEMYIALQFERMYTKNEILEFYLNEIFLGYNAYGVQSAANYYFNKDTEDLTLAESALIAALIKAPNYYSPYNNKEAAKQRRNLVLEKMAEHDYISDSELKQAQQEPIKLESPTEDNKDTAPYFVRHVRKKLIDKFGSKRVYTGGLKVQTTLSPTMQDKAEQTVTKAIENREIPTLDKEVGRGEKQPQLALVTINSNNGHIKTMIGGRNNDKFNRVTQAHRQPGSAFKPFVYTAAIQQGMSPGSIVDDTLKEYKTKIDGKEKWVPSNYNDKYLGPTTLRLGLAKSINVMAVKLLDKVGIDDTIKLAQNLGIESLISADENLALSLGGLTKGVTPLEMTKSYSAFANQGIKIEPIAITKVHDSKGNLIWDNEAEKTAQKELALDRSTSYLVTDMLQSAVARGPLVWGTGWRAKLNRPMAGKTGTTSNYTDAWFVGYTPNLVTSVWIGEDQPTKMEYPKVDDSGKVQQNEEGEVVTEIISSGEAAKLWGDYMKQVVKNREIQNFKQPDNIITKEICTESGKLPNEYCQSNGTVREELFIKGTEPTEKGTLHKETDTIKIDTSTGLIATDACPKEEVKEVEYQVKTGIIVDDKGVPVKKYKENSKIPITNEKGNYVYQEVPKEQCTEHETKEESEKIKDKILNFFNILQKE